MEDVIAATMPRLKIEEGYRKFLYKDTEGHNTVGYGYNIDANGISEAIAELLLQETMLVALTGCKDSIKSWNNINVPRQSVLLDLAYNMGIGGLMGFETMLSKIEQNDYTAASQCLLNSLAAKQEPARIEALAKILETGELESN